MKLNSYGRILLSALLVKFASALVTFSYFFYIDRQTFEANKAFWRNDQPDWLTFFWVIVLLGIIVLLAVEYYGQPLQAWENRLRGGEPPSNVPPRILRRAAAYPLIIALVNLTVWLTAGWLYARGGAALLAPVGVGPPIIEIFGRIFIGLMLLNGVTIYTLVSIVVDNLWRRPNWLLPLLSVNVVAWAISLWLFNRGDMMVPPPEVYWRTFIGIGLIGGLIASTLVFLIVDNIWRRHLPVFFPAGGLNKVGGPRISVGARLIFTSLLIGLTPLLALGAAALSGAANLQLLILFIVSVGIGSNILLNTLVARSLLQPLRHLTEAIDKTGMEKTDLELSMLSNDELGDLTHHFRKQLQNNRDLLVKVRGYSAELEEKNKTLAKLNRLKDEFLANTSHELRTPLNGIIGIAESMIDGATGSLMPAQVKNLSMITLSGRRLANLINDILDFSKLKHRALNLQIKPLYLQPLIEVVLTLSQPLIDQKPLTLENKADLDTPPVYGDENRIQQILHNLVGNAIKFSEKGTIEVSTRVEGDQVAVVVSDTGVGIAPDQLEYIFQAFEQADGSTTRLYGGTGLGLTITRQLVELHGGQIEVESRVGQGSQFTFTLPISPDLPDEVTVDEITREVKEMINRTDLAGDETLVETGPAVAADHEFSILVVDDEPVNRQVLVNQLLLQKYQVGEAANGVEALKLIREGLTFDLIVLDVMMPRMSGYEVCREIRRLYPATELPVIMLTAKNQLVDLVTGFDAGANDYLAKPFSRTELLARIKTHLQISNLRQLNESKDKFFSIISHDLKGPFMPLLGMSELLNEASDAMGPDELKEIGGSIHRSAQNVYSLLETLLHWSRLQMGRMAYEPDKLNLTEIIDQNIGLLAETAANKGLTLESTLHKPLWAYGDKYMLDMIIRNLTANALKFTPGGGRVTLSARVSNTSGRGGNGYLTPSQFIEVAVTDTGVGMSEEDQAKLFKFGVHHSTLGTQRETGTGLGLILCHEMVTKHGGKIWVESEPGQGSTFKFTVPAYQLSVVSNQ